MGMRDWRSEVCSSDLMRVGVVVGGEYIEPQHDIGLVQVSGRLEGIAVYLNGLHQLLRRKVRGEGIGQAQRGSQLGAEQAGAQYPHGNIQSASWNRLNCLTRLDRKSTRLNSSH